MLRSVSFSVPLVRGKGRPRFGKGKVYTPRATREAEAIVAAAYADAGGVKLPKGVPVQVIISTTRNVRGDLRKSQGDSQPDIDKPDADNIAKLVLDALNGVAYEDDAQVNGLCVFKQDRIRGQRPCTRVHVSWEE